MPEIDLSLIAKNQELIKSLTDASLAFSNFADNVEKNMEDSGKAFKSITEGMQEELKRLGISEQEWVNMLKKGANQQEGILEGMQNDLKVFRQLKERATTTEGIEKFNNKIKETQKKINDLNGETKKTGDGINSLKGGFLKMFAVLGGGYAVIKGFNALLSFSDKLGDGFAETMQGAKSGVKSFFNALTSGSWSNFTSNLKEAIKAGQEYARVMDELEDKRVALSFKEADASVQYVKYMNIIKNTNALESERRDAAEKLIKLEDDLATKKNDIATKAFEATKKRIAAERGVTQDQLVAFVTDNKRALVLTEGFAKLYAEKLSEIDQSYKPQSVLEDTRYGVGGGLMGAEVAYLNQSQSHLKKAYDQLESLKNLNSAEKEELLKTYTELQNIQKEFAQKTGRAQRVQDMLDANRKEESIKADKEIIDSKEEFLKMLEDLNKRSQQAQLEGLEGIDRIDKEEEFAKAELAIFEKTLKSKGKITQDQSKQLDLIRAGIERKANLDRVKYYQDEAMQENSKNAKVIELQVNNAEDQIDLTDYTEKEKLQLKIDAYKKGLMLLESVGGDEANVLADNLKKSIAFAEKEIKDTVDKKPEFSIWSLFGIDENTDKGKDQIEGIKTFTSSMLDSISQIMDAEANMAAERTRQSEDRLNELESQLEEELSLQEDGLANNVSAVKKQIEETKIEKAKAIEEEKKIQQAQMALDSIAQISSLITASANIFKATSFIPAPLGQILAIAAIGTMFGFMASAKIKAAQATKMEQGGYIDSKGIVHGKDHQHGGENLSSMVEVREGEFIPVINKPAVSYYGNQQLGAWTNAINRKQFPKFDIKPELRANQTFNLKTGMMNSELKAIRTGIENLNHNILSQSQTNHTPGTRIEKTKNRTRIIHVKN